MHQNIYKYIAKHVSANPRSVDRLIISAFVNHNRFAIVQNELLLAHLIRPMDTDWSTLQELLAIIQKESGDFSFEELIELFEFVISPSEKVINGAVYTPNNIRDYIVENGLQMYRGELADVRSADLSCGCGGFLLTLSKLIKTRTGRTFTTIFRENIYGIDIAPYSIQRTRLLLSLYAVTDGEDEADFEFNLYTGNSLIFDWRANCPEIGANGGFGLIVGNPPYVCSRNMDEETLTLIKNWEVARTGHPDLYIPFFQIGIEQLSANGILGYITVNSFIKSINGRALRAYFEANDIHITLLNFGGEQIFRDRNTYTCICFLKHGGGSVDYIRTESENLSAIHPADFQHFEYADLDHHDGWNLLNDQALVDFINMVEGTGQPFKMLYDTKNGIATLKNDVYKFKPVRSDALYHYLDDDGVVFPIERAICKKIVNANKLKSIADLERLAEQIIFPYDGEIRIIPTQEMDAGFPMAYAYLKTKKTILATRDKGSRDYETWYAYGRRQSMDIRAFKLFFPHICEKPTFVVCEEPELLFYNGIALVSENMRELLVIKKVLESGLFLKYISNSTKDYASGYMSMSRNYLKNFGVYQFTEEQKTQLLETEDVEVFLEELYGVVDLI